MNIFNGSYKWRQIGLLKLSMLAIGIVIGANWPQVFVGYTTMLVVVAVVIGIYLGFVWFKK
ncbi:MAG: hypothetical protein A2664_01960 [Candidatus Taylorbacteria bacterium RIFCSPHIGHO2_01_FULL_46_22b]|uniref:Uncharacterized protein n=1 Tax=Candidatus Taylorbacteria bacterium RIFCSPHIGHO2_01_FULL_46_22b TaxID=1802301 RepID=A0A1G2M320_9BACT|nr:MAG: hypothetical protein A2664_01960 [Candidatus Taylorbacteria bacterium RIFCSPHIGHO2_01_FULL_46_22b]